MKSFTQYAKPCPTCPWLKANHGKPNPPGVESLRANGVDDLHDWFSTKNLRRLWHGIRRGEGMLCHSTDPQADRYGGKKVDSGHERICTGCVALAERHIRILEAHPIKEYNSRISAGMRFTKHGFGRWIERVMFGGNIQAPDQSLDFGVPWECDISNKPPMKK